MAEMGSTGTVSITPDMMTDAKKAVAAYREVAEGNKSTLDGLVSGLIPRSFEGAAARGFEAFYTSNIEKAAGESLKGLLDGLDGILDSILKAIPDTNGLDDQLGAGNNKGE